ncbi:competence type IV pilus minor pilin ComGF [Falsibacillus pallidus]|uniref:Competence protein ComGF n=1 Tax=Falsibacillus pallidus TaxID=493781 RepID=A0A370GBJ6_9BACI|nr:competence type IV pilus minor pilin ComGF [Falsibacillus pallidus]RDI41165.1 competence protein ComGF [Falsibacillus pallidus]
MNEKGFTLVESLMVLLVFTIICSFLPLIFSAYHSFRSFDPGIDYEWELFMIQLRNEVHQSESVSESEGRIILQTSQGEVLYEKYQNVIRRRVNQLGHEIVLQDIQSSELKLDLNQVVISIQFTDGERRSGSIALKSFAEGGSINE